MAFDRRIKDKGVPAPKKYSVPIEYSFWQFRRQNNWMDEETFLNQPDDNLWILWEIFQVENEEG